jgi:hypothetical protein
MRNLLALALCLMWVSTASAFQPRTGTWFNPAEGGRAFNVEIQDGVMILIVYTYQASGPPQWYLTSGAMTNSGHSFTGTLDKYQGGQCIACAVPVNPIQVGNDGVISINFISETTANVTLPGGRVIPIQPFNFGIGNPPVGLLGEWIFVYDIVAGGATFAERYDFTAVGNATSTGNGAVLDFNRFATCELQIAGTFAGQVICIDFTDSTATTAANLYQFVFGLDQTYSGFWVSPSTFNMYSMQGFKVISRSGFSRSSAPPGYEAAAMGRMAPKDGSAQPQCGAMTPLADPEMTRLVEEMRQGLCAGR